MKNKRFKERARSRIIKEQGDDLKLYGIVHELAGILKGKKVDNIREGYTDYLIKKYR